MGGGGHLRQETELFENLGDIISCIPSQDCFGGHWRITWVTIAHVCASAKP